MKKDSDRGKATLPKLLGKQKTVETMMSMLGAALEEIKPFGENAEPLAMIAKYIGERLQLKQDANEQITGQFGFV